MPTREIARKAYYLLKLHVISPITRATSEPTNMMSNRPRRKEQGPSICIEIHYLNHVIVAG